MKVVAPVRLFKYMVSPYRLVISIHLSGLSFWSAFNRSLELTDTILDADTFICLRIDGRISAAAFWRWDARGDLDS